MIEERIVDVRARLDARARAERDDPAVGAEHGTRWHVGDAVADCAVLLLHGFTNSPPQYDALLPALVERGCAVVVPRLPYHGYRDRMTTAIARLRTHHLTAAALDGVGLAALCGRRVVVLGISAGATLAGWLAARVDVDHAIAVAPFCGVRGIPGPLSDATGALLRRFPNRFLWWDPRRKTQQSPPHAYPQFPSRGLGEMLGISTELVALDETRGEHDADNAGAHARRCTLVLNARDPAVNNAHARRRFARLREFGVAVDEVTLRGVPPIHDIVEPAISEARTELVYPALLDMIAPR
ncbi:MAG: alpha/beta fold hydrolase [Candidatus Eremiobacteraeota bacterium]|nr:alpha/beta fold hydrolase [Candidatus Eremiobacteraeota bacterium]